MPTKLRYKTLITACIIFVYITPKKPKLDFNAEQLEKLHELQTRVHSRKEVVQSDQKQK